MAARTVDKLRATLPGGNIGEYQITGFSSSLLNALEITEAALRAEVARAGSDAEIAEWIRAHTKPERYGEINAKFEGMTIAERSSQPQYFERYPVAKRFTPETPHLDVLAADDEAMFAADKS